MGTPTQNETNFLTQLRTILTSDDATQQTIYDLMYDAAEAKVAETDGESTAAEIAEALQAGIDQYKEQMRKVVDLNRAEANRQNALLKKAEGNEAKSRTVPISGREELEGMGNALTSAVTAEKLQAVLNATTQAGLPVGDAATFSLDVKFDAQIIEKVGAEQTVRDRKIMSGKIAESRTIDAQVPFKKGGRIKGEFDKFVVRGDIDADDAIKTYDTLDGWVDEVYAKNGRSLPALTIGGKTYPAIEDASRSDIKRWIIRANDLKPMTGKDCNGKRFTAILFPEGHELAIPPVEGFAPPQNYFHCKTCEVNVQPLDFKPVSLGDVVIAGKPQAIIAPVADEFLAASAPAPKTREHQERFHHASQSTDGETYRVGSHDHALMALARSGLDPRFTEEYYAIHNIVARKRIKRQKDEGQIGENSFGDEGKGFAENRESTKNNKHAKRDADTGDKGFIGESITGGATVVYFPGDAEVITSGADIGGFKRYDGLRSNFAFSKEFAMEIAGRQIVMPLGGSDLPAGYSIGNPSHQEKFYSMTTRWGLGQVKTALAAVNFDGYDNLFRNQNARETGPQETEDRIYDYMHVLNAQKNLVEGLAEVDNAKTLEGKQAAAERALIAYRDFKENTFIVRVDSLKEPLKQSEAGMRAYLASQGVDVAAIDTKLSTAPRTAVVDMPQEQLEKLQAYHRQEDKRFHDIKPGQTNIAYTMTEQYAYHNQSYFEHEVAEERAVERSEAEVSAQTWGAWKTILGNDEALAASQKFIAQNHDAQVEISNLLHDIHRNPHLYGFKNAKEAKEQLLDKIVPRDNEAARDEMLKKGRTSPILAFGDERFHNQNPQILAELVANADPEVFRDLITRGVSTDLGFDRKGRTDGRPFGRALLHAYGAEMDAPVQNAFGTHYNALAEALGKDGADEIRVREAVRDASAYVEAGATGRSVNAVQYLDNRLQDEQIKANETGVVDANKTYSTLFVSEAARKAGADKIAVLGLSAHAPLARDAILATILNNPEALKRLNDPKVRQVIDDEIEKIEKAELSLKDVKHTSSKNEYGDLKRTLNRTARLAAKYQRSGDADDLEKTARKFGMFFTEAEAHAEGNTGALHMNAWNVMIKAIGSDAAMSAAVVETIGNDAELRDAFIKTTRDGLIATDGTRVTNQGKRGTGRQFADTSADEAYSSRFFTLPTNSKGKVKVGGLFGIGRNQVDVNIDAVTSAIGHVNPLGEGVTSNRSARDQSMDDYVNGAGDGSKAPGKNKAGNAKTPLAIALADLNNVLKANADNTALDADTRTTLSAAINAASDALDNPNGGGEKLAPETLSKLSGLVKRAQDALAIDLQTVPRADRNNLMASVNSAQAELKANGVTANLSNGNAVSLDNGVKGPVKMAQTTAQLNANVGLPPEIIAQLQKAGMTDLGWTKNNMLGTNPVAYIGNVLLNPKLGADAKQQIVNNLAVPVVTKMLTDNHVTPPDGLTQAQFAHQLIAGGYITAHGDPKQLTLSTSNQLPISQTLDGALHVGSNLGAVGGFDTRWLAVLPLFIPVTKTVTWTTYIDVCPDCGPVGGQMRASTDVIKEGGIQVGESLLGKFAPSAVNTIKPAVEIGSKVGK